MAKQQKPKGNAGSTQKFIEVEDIQENIVMLAGGSACLVIEVQATNFALLSHDEQAGKIAAYAQLLNSLTFPIEILIKNKPVDISGYLTLLENEAKTTKNEKLALQIGLYHDFVADIVKVNTVLDKKFYLILPYSSLEKTATQAMRGNDSFTLAKTSLSAKAETVLTQFARLSLSAHVLEKEELVKLYYEIFNDNITQSVDLTQTYNAPIIQPTSNQPAQPTTTNT